jgi:hypothetical protein
MDNLSDNKTDQNVQGNDIQLRQITKSGILHSPEVERDDSKDKDNDIQGITAENITGKP